jgi:hypothetical protein
MNFFGGLTISSAMQLGRDTVPAGNASEVWDSRIASLEHAAEALAGASTEAQRPRQSSGATSGTDLAFLISDSFAL